MHAPNEMPPVCWRQAGLARPQTAGSTNGRRMMEGDGAVAARRRENRAAGGGLILVTIRASASILDSRKAQTTRRFLPPAQSVARRTGPSPLAFWAWPFVTLR